MWQPGMTIEFMEREAVLKAWRFYGHNKTQTANALGIAIRTLDAKLQKYLPAGEAPTPEPEAVVPAPQHSRRRGA